LRKIAKETGSQALAADAMHFTSDIAGSALVLVGLVAALFGFKYGDALAAIGVAGFISVAGFRLGRQTLETLLDAAPKGMGDRISSLIASVPGVVEVGEMRLRSGGAETFGEVTVVVSRTMPLDRVNTIKEQIVEVVHAEYKRTSLTIVVVPRALNTETVLDRIMLTAAKRRLPVHHVTVQDIGQRLSIGLDIEVDGRMSLAGAHTLASKFEAALRDEIGADTEVETHIEPLEVAHLTGQEASPDIISAITCEIEAIAAAIGTIREVHSVRVRDTASGFVVMYHCRAEAALDVQNVHACMDAVERELRIRRPDIIRAVGHAEPMRLDPSANGQTVAPPA
jgi:divalent metal cation (Fe/Co/Zn/Cd) transporter